MSKKLICGLTLLLASCATDATEKFISAGQFITPFVVGVVAIKSISSIEK